MGATTQSSASQSDIFAELDRIAPDAPFLALGQTVLWDEPAKAGVILRARELGFPRRFVGGVHDSDYFAKLPGHAIGEGFISVPHNDTTTRALWSAAAEFSSLFGSETVTTREALVNAGLRLHRLQESRPGILDQATEAFGWRGLVSLNADSRIVADIAAEEIIEPIIEALRTAVDDTLARIAGSVRPTSEANAEELLQIVREEFRPGESLSAYYQRLLPRVYAFAAGQEMTDLETTCTLELLKFNSLTCQQPRFEILNRFLDPLTRFDAVNAYNDTVRGSEVYTLDRFGSWAIPFDLVIPGVGRGTVRVAPKAIVIMTPHPLFITLKQPVTSVRDLARAIEGKFGPDCALVGKAITMIGMLAREFVFVFHHGASGYVRHTRKLLGALYPDRPETPFHPILRVRMEPWDALDRCCSWFRLPEPLRGPFSGEESCATSFAGRWRDVVREQRALRETISRHRSPVEFIKWLAAQGMGSWQSLAQDYQKLHDRLHQLELELDIVRNKKKVELERLKGLKRRRNELQHAKGVHFREFIFEKSPTEKQLAARKEFDAKLNDLTHQIAASRAAFLALRDEQESIVRHPEVLEVHQKRRNIELEADLKRLKLVHESIVAAEGLERSGHRPSAWWFPLVCPTGSWFRATMEQAVYELEVLR